MTPLQYIATEPTLEDARSKGLVFPTEYKDSLLAKQKELDTSFKISPVELSDGRWAINCDTFTEIQHGVYQELFGRLDTSKLNSSEIIPWEDVLALLPKLETDIDY